MWSEIQQLITSVYEFFAGIFTAFKDWVLDIVFYIFDKVLSVVETFIRTIDFPEIWNTYSNIWSFLPDQFLYLFHQVKLDVCIAIIAGAYTVRFLLNLIPGVFTRI